MASALVGVLTSFVHAHEFWIEPQRYQVTENEAVIAHFKNGEVFVGINLAFFDRRSERFDYLLNGETTVLSPRMGNLPALDVAPSEDGLMVVVHETAPSLITYKEWEKFQAFADHKDFPDIRNRHRARGLPETDFAERYTRHAKALIGIGAADGTDERRGLRTEFVALANPYTDEMAQGLPVRLFDGDTPRDNAQVEVFERAPDGSVTVSLTRTDDTGHATIPVRSGHAYLLDAVILQPSAQDSDAVWQTHWAALTFAVP